MTVTAIAIVALGTYLFRAAGPALRHRVRLSSRLDVVMRRGAVVMLTALIVTAAVLDGQRFAGWALPCGVVVGGVLAWRKAPFVVVVLAAAGVTAGLRLLGVA